MSKMIYDHPDFDRHHEVLFHADEASGLRTIVAIHKAWQAPSVGGCRMLDYASDAEALRDVLRLSRGMTYKSVLAGLSYGGAKAVILGVPSPENRRTVLRSMADFVDRLGGRFRTGVDVGLTPEDVAFMSLHSPNMVGTGPIAPDELTAHGVRAAIRAAAAHRLGATSLNGLTVSVLGLGKVGGRLARLLIAEGAKVFGADVDETRNSIAQQAGVEIVGVDDAHRQDCDVLAPCALGSILNDVTIPELRCAVVAGAANNQFDRRGQDAILAARGILYAPDFIANSGGLLAVAMQLGSKDENWAWKKIDGLRETLDSVFELSEANDLTPLEAAERIGRERIEEIERSTALAA